MVACCVQLRHPRVVSLPHQPALHRRLLSIRVSSTTMTSLRLVLWSRSASLLLIAALVSSLASVRAASVDTKVASSSSLPSLRGTKAKIMDPTLTLWEPMSSATPTAAISVNENHDSGHGDGLLLLHDGDVDKYDVAVNVSDNGTNSSDHSYPFGPGSKDRRARSYMVHHGESMQTIANRYGISTQDLMNANPQVHAPSDVHEGDVINVPEPSNGYYDDDSNGNNGTPVNDEGPADAIAGDAHTNNDYDNSNTTTTTTTTNTTAPSGSGDDVDSPPVVVSTPPPTSTNTNTEAPPTPAPTAAITTGPTAAPATNTTNTAQPAPQQGDGNGLTDVEHWLIYYTNELRAQNGKLAQCGNLKLMQAARISAEKQADCDQMGHTTCDGATPDSRLNEVGYQMSSMAENVAMNGHCGDTAQECAKTFVEMWKESPGHMTNMMSDNTMMGMSKATSSTGNDYATQVFGNSEVDKCDFNVQ